MCIRDRGENGTNTITVTPTPSPEPAPSAAAIATYTPIPKDECQQSFDRLWSFYMADFINNGPHNLEDAEATADALIDSIWLTTNTDSIGWNYEQMDLYSDSAYALSLIHILQPSSESLPVQTDYPVHFPHTK